MLRSMLILSLIAIAPTLAIAKGTSVKGYTTKKGTYVAPHHKSSANGTQRDNYSSKGNSNPYTGKSGTKTPKK